ncbi:MAG: ParB/RepB/Spo0J family partition protein [Gemmatimonadetes bacterium]|nr:ParB/RepB/Spo0J family partition protein [Gemmatimonadota bacterium]
MNREPRQRLGRGLGALLGEDYLAPTGRPEEARTIPVAKIDANPFQPRREFREEELHELAKSIRENGLLQPLVVRPAPGPAADGYQLVAGERRLRAVKELGWTEVPAVVREVDDRTLLVLALVENLQREALGPLEEAQGYQHLADEFGLTQGEIAEAVGKNRATIANTLRLLRLPPAVRALLASGSLSMGHARALLAIEDPARLVEMARLAAKNGWSVREVESRVRDDGGATASARRPKKRPEGRSSPAAHAYQQALSESLGTRVRVKEGRGGAGTIEVSFASADDFARLFELIARRDSSEIGD